MVKEKKKALKGKNRDLMLGLAAGQED